MRQTRGDAKAGMIPKVSENDFTDGVIALAKLRKWRVAHFRPGRTAKGWRTPVQGHKGFPDLVLVRPPRLIIAELKTATGRVEPEQQTWLDALADSITEVYLWRPADLVETIPKILR